MAWGKQGKLISALAALALVLSACAGGGAGEGAEPAPEETGGQATPPAAEEPAEEPALPEVELVWYYLESSPQSDLKSVQDAVNEYIKPKLNATVQLKPIPGGDYDQKMNTMLAANEAFDLMFTANWRFNYNDNAKKGAFMEIDDLLKEHGTGILASLPEFVWDDVRYEGKLYAVPNYQIAARAEGFSVQKRFADKYGLDPSEIKTYRDMEPFFEQIKQNEPGIVPFGINGDFNSMRSYGYGGSGAISFKLEDGKAKVVNRYATPEYEAHVRMAREWFEKGYINADAATLKNKADIEKTGVFASTFDYTMKPGGEANAKAGNGGHEVIYVPLVGTEYTGVQAALTAISRTSKNPERAMMFLNLVNTDPVLYNLLSFGIEGKHYDKVGDNTIAPKADGGYNPGMNWVMGDVTIGYLLEGQPADTWERTRTANETAEKSILYGFKFDSEAVKSESANIKAVEDEFRKVLETGSVDPDRYLPQFLDKLEKAGMSKLVEEQQKQVDAWLAANGQ